jgi:hypothetical protein
MYRSWRLVIHRRGDQVPFAEERGPAPNIRVALERASLSSFLSKGQIRVAEEDFGGASRCSRCIKRGCARNEKKKDLTKI